MIPGKESSVRSEFPCDQSSANAPTSEPVAPRGHKEKKLKSKKERKESTQYDENGQLIGFKKVKLDEFGKPIKKKKKKEKSNHAVPAQERENEHRCEPTTSSPTSEGGSPSGHLNPSNESFSRPSPRSLHSIPAVPQTEHLRALLIQHLISEGADSILAEQVADQFELQQRLKAEAFVLQERESVGTTTGSDRTIPVEPRQHRRSFDNKHMVSLGPSSRLQASNRVSTRESLDPVTRSRSSRTRGSHTRRPGPEECEVGIYSTMQRPRNTVPDEESRPVISENPPIIEATPVQEFSGEVVYAEKATFGIKYMLKEPKIRRLLVVCCVLLVVVAVVATTVVVKGSHALAKADESSVSATISPTESPTSAPTRILDEIEQSAGALSGFATVLTEGSPQRRAVSWLSSVDEFDTQGLGVLFSDRYILTLFYFATNGQEWLEQETWLSPTLHVCEWSRGIICVEDSTQRQVVNRIDLTRYGLTGHLPSELRLLDGLTHLCLSKNSLNGAIPAEFAEMTSLTLLDLSMNQLTGPIPSQVGQLQDLLSLELQDNELTGTIPSSTFDLGLLEKLDLSKNNMTGSLSQDITQLQNLGSLNLRTNSFSGRIPSFAALRSLDFIWLDYNQFSGDFTDIFDIEFIGRLEVTMSHNRLSGSIPGVETFNTSDFIGLEYRVQRIDISYNQMEGQVTPLLAVVSSLKHVDVSGNSFSGLVPAQIEGVGWQSLEYCSVAGNKFIGAIPLGFTEKLTSLNLSGNQLTGEIPLEFYTKFTKLEFLALNDNPISGTLDDALENLVALQSLELGNCSLTGTIPSTIRDLTNLEYMSLYNNKIDGFIPSSFGFLTLLQNLELEHNDISGSLPPELGSLTFLNVLNLAHNRITGFLPNSFGLLTSLEVFDVSGNLLVGDVPQQICDNMEITTSMVGCDLICSCCQDSC